MTFADATGIGCHTQATGPIAGAASLWLEADKPVYGMAALEILFPSVEWMTWQEVDEATGHPIRIMRQT